MAKAKNSRPKILVITSRYPYPVVGGDRLRIHGLCSGLASYYEIDLLSLCDDVRDLSAPVTDTIFSKIDVIYLSKFKSIINSIIALLKLKPMQSNYYFSNELKIRLINSVDKYDFIVIHLARMAWTAKYINTAYLLDLTDAISLTYERMLKVRIGISFKKIIYLIESKFLKRYEIELYNTTKYKSLISSIDLKYLASDTLTSPNASEGLVVTNGVSGELFRNQYDHNNVSYVLVFIGDMRSLPNQDAVIWFAEFVLPKLLLIDSRYKLRVIGRASIAFISRMSEFSDVSMTGFVPNVLDHVDDALASICCIRFGAGVQNKVLEALAMGLPTISSKLGVEGIDLTRGENVLIADTEEEYVTQIVSLGSDFSLRKKLSISGRAFVSENMSWEKSVKKIVNLIECHPKDH